MARVHGEVFTDEAFYTLQHTGFRDGVAEAPGNGLVEALARPGAPVVPGEVLRVTCGTVDGPVRLSVEVLGAPPTVVESGWDEVVEVSLQVPGEGGCLVTLAEPEPPFEGTVLPPGSHRVRVHARGREAGRANSGVYDGSAPEEHLLLVWPAVPWPQRVLVAGGVAVDGRELRLAG